MRPANESVDLKFHPLADIFPLLEGEGFTALVTDIRESGLREPITLQEGMILDGRNRYRACIEAQVSPTTEPWDGQGTPLGYVLSKNLHRRHLSESQRAMVAAKIANMPSGTRTDLPPIGGRSIGHALVAQTEAAELMNVGQRSVQRANVVLASGMPQLQEAVEAGKVPLRAAERIVRHHRATRLKLPDGMSPEQVVRKGLAIEAADGASAEEVGTALKVNPHDYRRMRDIVLLSDRPDLLPADGKTVRAALDELNTTSQIVRPYEMVKDLVLKVWGPKRSPRTDKRSQKRVEMFYRAMDVVVHACSGVADGDIPYLSQEKREEMVKDIRKARKDLTRLEGRLLQESNAERDGERGPGGA